jgi:hypothetical protein
MSKETDNGNLAAYPRDTNQTYATGYDGLTKRELFAAMVLQGFITHYGETTDSLASWAVRDADDLLKELAK